MTDFGTHKQHGTGVLASRYTSPATDARRRIHSHVGGMLWNQDGVGIGDTTRGGTDVASRLDDFVEGRTIHHEVTDDRESFGAPRFNPDVVAVLELAHVELAGGDTVVVAVRPTVDVESAHATNALAAVVVEANGMRDTVVDESLVQDVEHFKEGAVGRDAIQRISLEMALGAGVLLSPNM